MKSYLYMILIPLVMMVIGAMAYTLTTINKIDNATAQVELNR